MLMTQDLPPAEGSPSPIPVERLIRTFTRMIFLGAGLIVVGVALWLAVPGGAGAAMMGGCTATGGVMMVVGVRERKRGHALLVRRRERLQDPGGSSVEHAGRQEPGPSLEG